jgi:NDP-sugar pyrophosphorylase family protein
VFADNLSAIDLEALLDDHLGNDAALTVAIHHETFRLPYGEVAVRDGRVVAYREKPEWSVLVSSGTYVLGSFALAAVPRNTRLDVWRLVQLLLERGATVRPFHDGAPWVDVNDAAALQRAEALVAAHPERLDCWFPAPDATVEKVLLHGPDGVLVELRPDGAWDLPGAELVRGRPLTIFDDVDVGSRRVIRHHIRVAEPDQARIATRRETPVAWLPVEDSRLTLATRRALAALGCGS